MKRWMILCCLGLASVSLGCAEAPPSADASEGPANVEATPADPSVGPTEEEAIAPAVEEAAPAEPAAEEAAGKTIELTPQNTQIEFVGLHSGDKPDPRHGSFKQFRGTAVVEGTLKSVSVEIETASLTTEIEKLTNHLKNADFFNVNQFPKASFKSTEIKDNGDGTVEITGDLMLLETSNSITFPATVGSEGELTLKADFKIDRTKWGMNYGVDKIEKEVPMTITIGG